MMDLLNKIVKMRVFLNIQKWHDDHCIEQEKTMISGMIVSHC
jgi:hypothetical protein